MKKLFISVPMKGRTEEAIKASIVKMHRIAEATIGEELELIQSYIENDPPTNAKDAVWYLGKSIQMLAEADYIAITDYMYEHKGCEIEADAARAYDIKTICMSLEYIAPDVWEKKMNPTYSASAVCEAIPSAHRLCGVTMKAHCSRTE